MMRLRRTVFVLAGVLAIVPALGPAWVRAAEDKAKEQEWPMYRGDAARSNRGAGGPPVLEALWRESMLSGEDDFISLLFGMGRYAKRPTRNRLRQAEKLLRERHKPIIPAFAPIAIAGPQRDKKRTLLLYKNYFGVEARDLSDGSLAWASPSLWSLQRLVSRTGNQTVVAQWLTRYQQQYPQILFENSTIGTLSTDGQFVYVVEDLAVPPRFAPEKRSNRPIRKTPGGIDFQHIQVRGAKSPYDPKPPPEDAFLGELDKDTEDAVQHNRLYALSLARSGALTWALGDDENDSLNDCYFLGPPLPLNRLLYVLVQRKQQVSLLCIDPQVGKRPFLQPKIVFLKPLAELRTSMLEDPVRRTQAAHLACGQGILVCPTNAGIVFGVDPRLNRLAWTYRYRKNKGAKEKDPPAPPNSKNWKTTAPVIAEDKVVFAPPDDSSLHCLNLRDGSLLWSRKKSDDDVYLAGVYAGKVLIVGVKSVQALSLTKGEIVWTQETGLPSGQGIAAGNAYYLPLARGAQSKQPEILVLDVNKGQAIAHHKMPPRKPKSEDAEAPGNLVFVEGKLISLTPWEIVVYPPRGGK